MAVGEEEREVILQELRFSIHGRRQRVTVSLTGAEETPPLITTTTTTPNPRWSREAEKRWSNDTIATWKADTRVHRLHSRALMHYAGATLQAFMLYLGLQSWTHHSVIAKATKLRSKVLTL